MCFPLTSKFPPNCGDVSETKSVSIPVKFAPLPLNDVAVIIPVVLTLPLVPIPAPDKPDPSPTNEVAVTIPVRLTLPVPVIFFPLTSKLPPSCGVVSSESSFNVEVA